MFLHRKMALNYSLDGIRPPSNCSKLPPRYCWRCSAKEGSLLHIWWECPLIQNFWKEIHRLRVQITTFKIEFSPTQLLLHDSTIPKKDYHQSLSLHLLNAMKMFLPVHWKSPNPPTTAEWIRRVNKVADMEELIHQTKDTSTKYHKMWACWQHFQTTAEYSQLLA